MNTKLCDKVFRVFFILAFVLGSVWIPNKNAKAQENNSFITAYPAENIVKGEDFQQGEEVTLTIDDPSNGIGADLTLQGLVEQTGGRCTGWCVEFNLPDWFTLTGGQEVTLSTNMGTVSYMVSDLTVDNIDVLTDSVSGKAKPSSVVDVVLWWVDAQRRVTADTNGNWSADFSELSADPFDVGFCDFGVDSGCAGMALQANGDTLQPIGSGRTRVDWYAPVPAIAVHPVEGIVYAHGWPAGSTITLTVDDPQNGVGIDYTFFDVNDHQDIGMWGSDVAVFDIGDQIGSFFGKTLSATNGSILVTYTVKRLTIDSIDPETDTITGTADPGEAVGVNTWDPSYTVRNVIADSNGNWIADFSIPGSMPEEEQTVNFSAGDSGRAMVMDGSSVTRIEWRAPNPVITVWKPSLTITSDDWPVNIPIQILIDDPLTPQYPDFSDTTYSQTVPEYPGRAILIWDAPDQSTIQPGYIVTVTNGITTRELIVSTVQITGVDIEADTVTGLAEPYAIVGVHIEGDSELGRTGYADDNGYWSVDFSIPQEGGPPDWDVLYDIAPGTRIFAFVNDDDRDGTAWVWRVPPLPTIAARPGEQQISGYDWPEGATIALAVDNPLTPSSPDYTDSLTADMQEWGQTEAYFDLGGKFYFGTGYIITMTDGTTTKVHTVTNLDVTEVDPDNDLVYGRGDPGDILHIFVWIPWPDSYAWRDVVADSNGEWIANFSIPVDGMTYDITDGAFGEVLERDDDEDFTNIYWYWPMAAKPCVPGDTVTGTVFEHDGTTPVPSATVQFEDFDTAQALFTTTTDENGQYACYLPDGDYRVQAGTDSYTNEYYNEAVDLNATRLQVTGITQLTDVDFTIAPSGVIEHFTFNLNNPLLQDRVIREAITLGIDRHRILNEAFLPNGIYGSIANSIVPPGHWAAAPSSDLQVYPFDPSQARAILEAAGWIDRDADGFRENADGVELAFVFKTNPRPVRLISAEIFRQNMEAIGIRITIEFVSLSEIMPGGNFEITEFAWAGGYDNEPNLSWYATGSSNNIPNYSNPAYDVTINNARAAVGNTAKLPYLYEAQSILSHDLPIFPLFTRYEVTPITTPAGDNITVSPETYLDIHFAEVTQEGVTTVISTGVNPAELPPNFQLLGQVYDIGTNALFTTAQACFTYDDTDLTPSQETSIRLFHLETNAWLDVTDTGYPDTSTNIICGTVTSFSPFAVMYRLNQPPVAEAGSGQIVFFGATVTLNASASSDPDGDPLTYEWDLDNDGEYDGATGVTIVTSFNLVGTHTVGLRVTDSDGLSDTDTTTVTVLPWTLKGFYQPVDMNGIYNIVKGGSTVPLKFEIFTGPIELTDVSYIKSLTYAQTTCTTTAITDEIETVATGGTSLRYDWSSGQFIFNWKTPSTPGKCYRVTLVTLDGSSLVAYFKLK